MAAGEWMVGVANGKFYSSWIYVTDTDVSVAVYHNKPREVLVENGIEAELLDKQYATEWDIVIQYPNSDYPEVLALPNAHTLEEAKAAAIALYRMGGTD